MKIKCRVTIRMSYRFGYFDFDDPKEASAFAFTAISHLASDSDEDCEVTLTYVNEDKENKEEENKEEESKEEENE